MRTLKSIISRYILVLALCSITIMLGLIVVIQAVTEQHRAYDQAMRTFSQMEQVLEENRRELAKSEQEYHQTCLNNAETIARILEGEPGLIYDVDGLKELARITEVDEIHIFDSTGCIFAGTHPQYYGYTFDSGTQMNFFKPMLADHTLQLVQEITPNTAEGKQMQYSALWSRTENFIVQVGMEPLRVLEATRKKELSHIFSLFSVSTEAHYYAVDAETGEIVGATIPEYEGRLASELGMDLEQIETRGQGFFALINGQRFFCVFKREDDSYLGRAVSCRELYQRIPAVVFLLAASMTTIVLILSCAITYYINHFVVRKLQSINRTLHAISMGDVEARVDIQSSLEFTELSRYLNGMIKSLLDSNKKMSYVLSKTNMYIGVYDYYTPLNKVRFTEYLPRILQIEPAQLERLAADYGAFRAYLDGLRCRPVPGEVSVYELAGEPPRYVKLEEIREQGEVMGVAIDVTDVVQRRQKIEYERDRDLLTGLYNRRGLDSCLAELFRTPEQLGASAFVMIDADGLKRVNDTYGHQKGDLYLKQVAETIRNVGPCHSVAARQGGDEFVLFLYGYETEAALHAALEALGQLQSEGSVDLGGGRSIPFRFSMGYSVTRPDADFHTLIKEADKRMYQNKRQRKESTLLD